MRTPKTTTSVNDALVELGGSYKHVAMIFMVGGVMSKIGMFSAEHNKKTVISFTDMTQGAAYWYLVLSFLIWGVENGKFSTNLQSRKRDQQAGVLREASASL